MKKTLIFLAVITEMVISLAACEYKNNSSSDSDSNSAKDPTTSATDTTDFTAESGTDSSETEAIIKSGKWNSETFTNNWLGIEFSLPENYNILSSDDIKDVISPGENALFNDDGNELEIRIASRTFYDFMVQSDDQINSFLLLYENAGTADEDEYYDSLISQILELETLGYKDNGKSTSKIAGENYTKASVSVPIQITDELELLMYQDYYIRKFNEVIVCFITTYTDETKNEMSDIISSIEKK